MRDLILLTDWFGMPDQPIDEPEPWPDARAESPDDDDGRPAGSPEDDACGLWWQEEEPQGAGDLEEMIDERIDERIDDAEACCEFEADRRNDRDRDEDVMDRFRHHDREVD
jgi:hypothetical protein